MTDLPDDARRGDDGPSPWEEMLRSVFGADADEALRELRARGFDPEALGATGDLAANPQLLGPILERLQRMLTQPGAGPVNADLAHDLARQVAVTGGDPSVTLAQRRTAVDALAVADLWLDAATELPPAGGERLAWSRSEWVERTLPAWSTLANPVASSMSAALSAVLGDQLGGLGGLGDPDGPLSGLPGLAGLPGLPAGALGGLDPSSMLRSLGSAVFGMQVGQAAGTLSREVFGATDVGVPLLPGPATVLVPNNVDAFAEGLDAPVEEVRHFLALREAAHARLFTHVTWLRAHLLGLVEAYARGITIDLGALEDKMSQVDLSDMDAMRRALSSGVFGLDPTPEQTATLDRLETTLALVEGWVDEVTARAAAPHLPHAVALREMLRRRRAAGGPAEQTFASLVGLELRPRRSREAAALWARIATDEGFDARDAVWDHPDLLPTAEDLDDPAGYARRRSAADEANADLDAALAEILGGGDDAGGGARSSDAPDEGTPDQSTPDEGTPREP